MKNQKAIELNIMKSARWVGCLIVGVMSWCGAFAQDTKPDIKPDTKSDTKPMAKRLTAESLWDLARTGEAVLSPDGKWIAYTVTRYVLADNEGKTELHVAEFDASLAGKVDEKVVASAFKTPLVTLKNDQIKLGPMKGLNSISWGMHGGKLGIVHIANGEEAAAEPQAWWLEPTSGARKQLTHIAGGIGNLKVSPTSKHLAFTRDIKLDATAIEQYPDLPKADARIIDSLMYRHWNAWHDYAYSHVHVAAWNEDGSVGEARDLMTGLKADCPLQPMGGAEQFNFSPDGREIAMTIKLVNNPASSTDSSVFLTDVDGGSLKNITPGMVGYDMEPIYSPNGRWIAFNSMVRPGFEADRNRIMLYDRREGKLEELTKGLDQTTHNVRWSYDSQKLFFDSEYSGTQQVYEIFVADGRVHQRTQGTFDFHVVAAFPHRDGVLVTQQSMLRPNEYAVQVQGDLWTVTSLNQETFAQLELPLIEERWVRATDGKSIHNWVILPPDFDPTKSYPMLVYCQGGPQGQIGQWFSYRWNFHLMADQGYVVLAVNRRGLPGFGQAWNDQISGDWGGQAMQDILAATDSMLTEPYVDSKRLGAVGASFGGYTVYWLMGNAQDRFKAMIAHCGVFNLESMYGSTEELFFVNYDLGGPYWSSESVQAKYNQFSPHRFIGNWKTPLLVIHGEKDFRVPVTQGMEAFTAAQTQGVPSRFLYFPNEGHWVTKPQNGVLWTRVFFDWLKTNGLQQ